MWQPQQSTAEDPSPHVFTMSAVFKAFVAISISSPMEAPCVCLSRRLCLYRKHVGENSPQTWLDAFPLPGFHLFTLYLEAFLFLFVFQRHAGGSHYQTRDLAAFFVFINYYIILHIFSHPADTLCCVYLLVRIRFLFYNTPCMCFPEQALWHGTATQLKSRSTEIGQLRSNDSSIPPVSPSGKCHMANIFCRPKLSSMI